MTDRRTRTRLCLTLWLTGVIAAMSLLAAPLEALQPPRLHFTWWQFRLLSLANPLLFLSIATAVGCWATRRVGLDAPLVRALLERRPAGAVVRRQLVPAVLVGLVTAAMMAGYAAYTAPIFAAGPKLPDLAMPLGTKLLYGGVVEELMMRWGLMSLLVWVAWQVSRRTAPTVGAYVVGIAGAALLFGAGHLPLLYTLVLHPSPALLGAVIVGNALPGALFGWLFWRRGLEAAMLAHALGHLIFTLANGGG